MPSTQSDEVNTENTAIDLAGAEEAFLSKWGPDEETPSETTEEETVTEEAAEPSEETETTQEEDQTETEEVEEDPEAVEDLASDEAMVEVRVGTETKRVSVSDLKRLYGQEASLTKKSQELAATRREVQTLGERHAAALDAMHRKALERLEPYKGIDLFRASRELSAEDFDALRSEIQQAQQDVVFFEQEVNKFMEEAKEQEARHLRAQVPHALRAIKERIPDWNDKVYEEVRTFAVSEGLDKDFVNKLIDPVAITLLHKAMLYDKAKQTSKAKVKAVAKAPTKVVKRTTRSEPNQPAAAMSRLAKTGDIDDATAVLLARWND